MEFYAIIGFTTVMLLLSSIRFVKEHDRLVVFRFGRAVGVRGPGPCFLVPFIEHAVRVDLRVVTMCIPVQEVITRDNVSAKITAVCFFQVSDPLKAVTRVEDPQLATTQIAQTTLRHVLGQHDFGHLLSDRNVIHTKLQTMIHKQTKGWGINIKAVEVKDFQLADNVQHLMTEFVGVLESLGTFYLEQGKFEQAEQLFKRSVELGEKTVSPDNPQLAKSLESYSRLLRKTERGDEADGFLSRALSLRAKN